MILAKVELIKSKKTMWMFSENIGSFEIGEVAHKTKWYNITEFKYIDRKCKGCNRMNKSEDLFNGFCDSCNSLGDPYATR